MLASGSEDDTILLWTLPRSARVGITPSPVESPAVGELLVVNVNIEGAANVQGYAVYVDYNSHTLRYVEHRIGDYLPGAVFSGPKNLSADWDLSFSAVSRDGVGVGDGILATITFEVVARRASTLGLGVVLSDDVGERLGLYSSDGKVIEPPWDVNGDFSVNLFDLALVASKFGLAGDEKADVNRDGIVDIRDLVLVASGMRGEFAAPTARSQAVRIFTPATVKG